MILHDPISIHLVNSDKAPFHCLHSDFTITLLFCLSFALLSLNPCMCTAPPPRHPHRKAFFPNLSNYHLVMLQISA